MTPSAHDLLLTLANPKLNTQGGPGLGGKVKLSYRKAEAFLKDVPEWWADIEMEKASHHRTLCDAFTTLTRMEILDDLMVALVDYFERQGLLKLDENSFIPFRMLNIVDEFTRECLAIDVARKLGSDDVLERLSWLMATRGVPAHIRSDNGSEFTATVAREWLGRVGVKTLFIEPGSPWENGYLESVNGKLRDQLLDREILYSLREAKVLIGRWREYYNQI